MVIGFDIEHRCYGRSIAAAGVTNISVCLGYPELAVPLVVPLAELALSGPE